MNDNFDELLKQTLNSIADNLDISDSDELLERIHLEILEKSINDKKETTF